MEAQNGRPWGTGESGSGDSLGRSCMVDGGSFCSVVVGLGSLEMLSKALVQLKRGKACVADESGEQQ